MFKRTLIILASLLSILLFPFTQVFAQSAPSLSGFILYASNKTGDWDIYMMDLETGNTLNLTNHPSNDMNPQPTADGGQMVFFSDRDGDNEIYQMDLANLELSQLTTNEASDYDPSYSPDGTRVVYKSNIHDGHGDIWIMDSDGSNQANLTPLLTTTEEWDPAISLDGQKIAFVSRLGPDAFSDELYTMNIDGTEITRITNNLIPDWYPGWDPITGQILFISKTDPLSEDDIFIMEADGTNRVQITTTPGDDDDPAISLSGERIVAINNGTGTYDLYLMDSEGNFVTLIAKTDESELSPVFLPQYSVSIH